MNIKVNVLKNIGCKQ